MSSAMASCPLGASTLSSTKYDWDMGSMPSAGFPCATCMTGTVLRTMSIGHDTYGFHWPMNPVLRTLGKQIRDKCITGICERKKIYSPVSLT